jgi:hypothetical protein
MKYSKKKVLTAFILFATVFLIYYLTGPKQKTHWDYFIRLAYAFLHKRLYLTEGPAWLNELVPVAVNKYYVVFPPMPAILIMPFVAIFGKNFSQTLFSQIIGSLNSVLAFLVFLRLKFKFKHALTLSLLLALGTNHWYLASVGSAWYLALIVAVFFSLLSLLELFGKKRYFLIGLLIGAAYWSRLPVFLSLAFPLLLIIKREKTKLQPILLLFLGCSIFIILNFSYNFARFNTIFDIAYLKIPGIMLEKDFQYGLFSFKNIPKHLKLIFLKMPGFKNQLPFIYPSWYGMALWLTTPAWFLIFKANFKKRIAKSAAVTAFLITLPLLMHSTVGFTQFGYRYAMDLTPFLLILTGMGLKNTKSKFGYVLVALSIIINLWGVLWINKFNWVSF